MRLFETAVEPFEVGLLDSGHLLLFRTVWRGGERLIQGALIEQAPFLERLIGAPLAATVAGAYHAPDRRLPWRGARQLPRRAH